MQKIVVLFLLLFSFSNVVVQAQINKFSKALELKLSESSSSEEILIWVYFNDKGPENNFYFNNPALVVSQKSLNRRTKVFGNSNLLTIRDLPVNQNYISQVRSNGFKVRWTSKWLNAVSGKANKYQLEEIASLPFIKKMDIVYSLKSGNKPEQDFDNSPEIQTKLIQPEGIHSYDYGNSYSQLQQINVPAVHDSGYTGQGVTICVMDAGFNRLSHDAFLSMNIIAAWDFVNNDPNVGDQNDMGEGSHGTMTLSNIGGFAPGQLIGPAFNADYILAKTENTESETPIEEDHWIAAMEWADSIGVDVTSTSLGYIGFDPPYTSYTWMDMDGNTTVITNGADYAAYIGIVVVNSAGNEGYNSSHNTLGAPADGDSVITAGAVTSTGSRSSFSSVGPTVDGRIKPDIMARGSSNVVASPYGDHSYTTASGTSFSCPLSAGVAALILCANPNLTPMQVREAMRNTASKSSNPDNLYGWGILNALNAINYFPPPPATFQGSVEIENGWNMVSIPGLYPTDQNVNTWWAFRDPGANVFRYAGGYQSVTDAVPGIGYWMKHAGARTYNTGDEWPAGGIQIVAHDPIAGASGWNLFGGYEIAATAGIVTTNPPGLQSGPIYAYSGGYQVATTLNPGYGYWIKLTGAGQIIIPETMAKGSVTEYFPENWGRIKISDATGTNYTLYSVKGKVDLSQYDLPPAPPAGMFDIRYESGRIAEDINSSIKAIDMSGVVYPLTVRVEGMDIRLMDESGKMLNTNLKSGEDVVISNATIQKLMVSGEMLPTVYSLEQNYPNPFNPSTVIEFSLPEDVANVKLSVYNALGEKVAELVNTSLTAGRYQYQWNAKDVATGMYIYKLRTDKFLSVKKMLLLK
ncbi:MAG: S8 family peptidase [bacterium]|nr:S8 family peptidase [bacterium]